MKFGLFGGAQAVPGDVVTEAALGYHEFGDYIAEAERLGYSSAWLVEHHFTGFAQLSATLNYIAYLAGRTSSIRLGSAVVVVPWHNPILLAEQVATVDQLSKGRYDFGIGRGYRFNEFHGFGMTIDDLPTIYAESMEIIQRAWREPERWSYKSERWEFNDIIVEPPCVQRPHPPMWQGAGSERSIRQAAREGYNLLLDQMTSFDGIAERVAIYRDEVEAAGRTFDPYAIGVTRGLMAANDVGARTDAHTLRNKFITEVQVLAADPKLQAFSFNPVAGKEATDVSEEGAIIGSSQEMVDRVGRLHDAGVRNILLHDLSGSLDALHQFAADVMPQFADDADTARAAE